ncbi:hypothetical protein TSOC_008808, partial [Tetrabaena socialis]
MCWERGRLAQLQHSAIANAAAAQQDRLSGLFPELMEPLAPAGPDAFAIVPFLDMANHADPPPTASTAIPTASTGTAPTAPTANADFRVSPAGDGASGMRGGLSPSIEPLPWDVVQALALIDALAGACGDLLGDALFMAALRGTDPYLTAALRSLPLGEQPEGGGGGGAAAAAGTAGGDASIRTAAALLRQVEAQIAEGGCRDGKGDVGGEGEGDGEGEGKGSVKGGCRGGTTPLEDDEDLLGGPRGAALREADPRALAAVEYRVERQRLLAKTAALLRAYGRGVRQGG